MEETQLPVVVIGAGPVGLSAAVRLVERSVDFVLLEASTSVAASLRDWGHVRLFSPWRYDVDAAAARLLEPTGWTPPPPEEYPTGDDLFRRYLEPLSKVPAIRRGLRLDRRVVAITRRGVDKIRTADRASVPLLVRTQSHDGAHEEFLARAVIDASGTWWQPNPLGASTTGSPTSSARTAHGTRERPRSSSARGTPRPTASSRSSSSRARPLAP